MRGGGGGGEGEKAREFLTLVPAPFFPLVFRDATPNFTLLPN